MVSKVETSTNLLNQKDTEALLFALRRIFYCYIKSSHAQDREDFDIRDKAYHPEIELSSVCIDPQEKISRHELEEIHGKKLNSQATKMANNLERVKPEFRYDQIIKFEGLSATLKDELKRIFVGLNFIESAAKTVVDIFFTYKPHLQLTHFKLLLSNFLVWGSYLPLSTLSKREVDIMNLSHTQKLSIVLFSAFF